MRDDGPTVLRLLRTVALTLAAVMAVIFGALYLTQPCWPWQEQTEIAGGTLCDGEPDARFDID